MNELKETVKMTEAQEQALLAYMKAFDCVLDAIFNPTTKKEEDHE